MKTLFCALIVSIAAASATAAPPQIESANRTLLEAAAQAAGVDLRNGTPQQQAAIENAFHWLRPGDRIESYPLNEFQARAIVFLAFSPQGRLLSAPNLLQLAYDLQRSVRREGRGLSLFLTEEEKTDIIALAGELRALATRDGEVELAKRAARLATETDSGRNVSRSTIHKLATEIKAVARETARPHQTIAADLVAAATAVISFVEATGGSGYLRDNEIPKLDKLCVELRTLALRDHHTKIADMALFMETKMDENGSFTRRRDMQAATENIEKLIQLPPPAPKDPGRPDRRPVPKRPGG